MELLDLPPDLTFPRLGMSPGDVSFSFEVKRAAMRPHIIKRWTWDEAFQRDLHQRHYNRKPFFEIRRIGQKLGTLSFQVLPDHVRLGEFYLFPEHQGQGTGSAILAHCLTIADSLNLPVRLEYLHWNPVGSLYRRYGFMEIGCSEIHCLMERPVVSAK
ncbi:N-acetyltransferase [Roseomonas gilardii]|uniref:GNAT family N-acetyltransferase n=1 Tax=Roseomonas gilardii TaxID=257708 RepID=UPI0011A22616|nr:GNAT family N-acetyltransferase [Roseomonas gilardii]